MKYHYKKPEHYTTIYGQTYVCDHPLYDSCTLYKIGELGLSVIQERMVNKRNYWSEIDPWLRDEIYLNPRFYEYFKQNAGPEDHGIYPTVKLRKLMWALKMKPLPKQPWES